MCVNIFLFCIFYRTSNRSTASLSYCMHMFLVGFAVFTLSMMTVVIIAFLIKGFNNVERNGGFDGEPSHGV